MLAINMSTINMSTIKQARHTLIRSLLGDERIDTHERLAQALGRRGVEVSQSTLSKDLRELGVVRIPQADGGFRYTLSGAGAAAPDRSVLERELRDCTTQIDRAGNMIVLRTLSGHAQAVCEALDRMAWPEVMGTLAGENTIFVASRTPADARGAVRRLTTLTGLAARET